MTVRTRDVISNWFYRCVFLFIAAVAAAACTGVDDQGDRTATPTQEALTAATSTFATTTIITHTIEYTPSPQAMPTSTLTSAATTPPSTPAPGPLEGEHLVAALRSGGYVIYFRHAKTDPVPDDADPVILSDCSTQRNLSNAGEAQAQSIGQAFEKLMIPVGRVFSSLFCRSLDTAQIAFGKATSEPVLENLETAENEVEREVRIEGLRRLLSTVPNGATNSILVGHGFNISAAADVTIAEGEAAIFLPEGERGFTLVATVTSGEWEDLGSQFAFSMPETYRFGCYR